MSEKPESSPAKPVVNPDDYPDDIREALIREAEQPQRQATLDAATTEAKVLKEDDESVSDSVADQLIAESIPPTRQLIQEVEAMEAESPVRMTGFKHPR